MTVGECVRRLREEAGFQQQELAERIGISASMLSLIESDDREPTISRLRSISDALEVPAGLLFAIALADQGQSRVAAGRRAKQLTDHLFRAVVHSLRAKRSRGG